MDREETVPKFNVNPGKTPGILKTPAEITHLAWSCDPLNGININKSGINWWFHDIHSTISEAISESARHFHLKVIPTHFF